MANIKWRNDGSGLGDIEGRDDLVMHDMVYRHPIRGAKKDKNAPRKPVIMKDSASSTSIAKIQYGFSEGTIWGLVDGAKSIILDGTPLEAADGTKNFKNVTYDIRLGTNDQTYMKGFPDVSNEVGIGVELKSSAPYVRAINDTQLSAVRVRLRWNGLSSTNSENGDVSGHRIDYAIDLQTDGGAYVEVLNTTISDKVSAGYERTHRIELPRATQGWQIRIRRLTANSSSEFIRDTMYVDAIAEVIDAKFNYPNTAHMGIEFDSEIFRGIPKLEAHVRGLIVRVPTNYDPVARTYVGIWDGLFKDAYTNNPAWIYYDIITAKRYGLGDRINPSMVDKWTVYALGVYCDQLVPDGLGGQEPRFTCNVYLQKTSDAYQVLSSLSGVFRAMAFWNGERIVLDADLPKDPVYTFSRANVIADENGICFNHTGSRFRDRHTVVKVAWDNPANAFQTEYEYVRDEKAISKYGIRVLDLSAFACTSQGQAQRAGLWALKTEQLETRQITFSVGLDGFLPQVADVVNVADEIFAGRANSGRVSAISAGQLVVTLDRDITVNAGDILIINGSDGKAERRVVKSVAGREVTMVAAFTKAEQQNIWALETADLKLMRFRIMSIQENSDSSFNITALQHEPKKFSAIDFGADVIPDNITSITPNTIEAPDNVAITTRHRVVQGQTVTTLIIDWSQVKEAVGYDVEWRKDNGNWIKVPRTGNTSVEIEGVYAGRYTAQVRSISAYDIASPSAFSAITEVKGKAGLPPNIVGLEAKGILFGMEISWSFQSGSDDAAYTEIQVGSAPDVNVATLTQVSYPTNTHTVTGLQGNLNQSYRARLVDKLGFESPWTAWVTGTTDANADKIMDMIQGQIDESSLNDILKSEIANIEINKNAISQETRDRIQAIIDANSRIDGVISNADVEYYLSTDATTPTGGEWLTTAPEWQQGKYVFSRTILTGADGTIKHNPSVNGVNITGAKGDNGSSGDKGDIGQGVDSIIEQYGVSRSETDEPTTWTAAAPVVTKGDYVWTRSEITYKDPYEVQHTDPIVSPAWAAISEFNTEFIDYQENVGNEFIAQGERLDGIIADYRPEYFDKTKYFSSTAEQWTYAKTVAADNYAANERITNLQSEFADNSANVTQTLFTLTEKDKSIASSVSQLYAKTDENYGLIQDVSLAISTPNTGLAAKVTELQGRSDAAEILLTEKGEIIFSYGAPPAKKEDENNIWFKLKNEDNGTISQTPHQWNGSAWVELKDSAAVAAKAAADTANQKLEPANLASLVEGSGAFSDEFGSISGQFANFEAVIEGQKTAMEVLSGVGNAEKLKNEIAKARLDKDVTNLNAQSVALTTQINGYTTKIAEITAKRNATADTALKAEYNKLITDLTAAKDDLTAQKAVIADQVAQLVAEKKVLDDFKEVEDGVRAQHTVKIDSAGKIVGFGLVLQNDGFSAFDVRADRFSISAPSGKPNDVNGTSPFMVLTNPQVIDGVNVPAGTYMRNTYIAKASIDLAQINTASITSLDALSATIGHFKSATTGARLEIKDSLLSVYDANNRLRVRLGLW